MQTHNMANRTLELGQNDARSSAERNEICHFRLQIAGQTRNLALFNLAIDSKLRACDLVGLRVRDVTLGTNIASRAIVMQQKTKRPVQFEITEQS
jgi:hypothetical protein